MTYVWVMEDLRSAFAVYANKALALQHLEKIKGDLERAGELGISLEDEGGCATLEGPSGTILYATKFECLDNIGGA